ncbi:MAG: type II methionyl aminopeptidase [Candidatus Aenigmarchaeota archaeon]|nr:type II methionyl aminopeptidase [Candidatus Aenigmarchaeota archaeon]
MEEEILEKYKKAGKIASEVREASRKLLNVGVPLLDIAEKIEAMIREKGGEPAFPANLSLNDIAAHYTPVKKDETRIPEGAILKVDLGVHMDGYVADTAYTVSFSDDYAGLVDASKSALENILELCTPGRKLADISAKIQETIEGAGYKPVSNLTGHGLQQYFLHADPHVPNVRFSSDYTLSEGQAIAIEPFATEGEGRIKETEPALIYMMLAGKPVRNPDARLIMQFASRFNGLPFAERWIPIESTFKIRMAVRELKEKGVLYGYPPLKEVSKGMVSQAEHTVIVADEPIVTTK